MSVNLDLWQHKEYTGIKPGLGRIRRFLEAAGNPHRALRAVQIAGTNGKGSTAALLSLLLTKAGYRTGLYTSPHLQDITERIQINGVRIPRAVLDSLAEEFERTAQRFSLTFFEFLTGLALLHFAREKTDIVILETGLGGRYDATNVIPRPLASIITDVDLDHEALLGTTLAQIAWEKAGIIKKGCPVISGVERPSASAVIRREAQKSRSPLYELHDAFSYTPGTTAWNKSCQDLLYKGLQGRFRVRVGLLGEHQAKNCSLALAGSEILRDRGYGVEEYGILASARWPGRFDVRRRKLNGRLRTAIFDGAHNPGAMKRFLAAWLQSPWGKKKSAFIFGMLKDKDYPSVIRELAPKVKRVILTPVRSPRTLAMKELSAQWQRYLPSGAIVRAASFADAVNMLGDEDAVAVTGSLYLIGEALDYSER